MPIPNSPTVTRGTFSIPATGGGRVFMFNPNTVNDSKATSWGSVEIPGASHPIQQYGAGGERNINFSLYLDGDRGRYGRTQARNTSSLSVSDELAFYRSLVYPIQYGNGAAAVFPYLILFNFGEWFNNVQCLVKKADIAINYWTPDLSPVRATIAMSLSEVPLGVTSVIASDFGSFLSANGYSGYEF